MKRILYPVLLVLMITAMVGCTSSVGNYASITPKEVKEMLDNGDSLTLVDVRTAGEYTYSHINGAINIPVESLSDSKPELLPDTNALIIVYCQTGSRSEIAAKKLIALGYTSVYDLGGIVDWPYETVSGDEAIPTSTSNASASGVLSAFNANDINGNAVDQSIFSDYKLTMVNVWATFCSPCIAEMPELAQLHSDYADKGFQVVGIVVDAADNSGSIIADMVDTAKDVISQTGADYLHLLPSSDLINRLLYEIAAVPTTIFVDAGGNQIGETIVGSHSGEEWASIIDELLKEVG